MTTHLPVLSLGKLRAPEDLFRCTRLPGSPTLAARTCLARQELAAKAVTVADRLTTGACRQCSDGRGVARRVGGKIPRPEGVQSAASGIEGPSLEASLPARSASSSPSAPTKRRGAPPPMPTPKVPRGSRSGLYLGSEETAAKAHAQEQRAAAGALDDELMRRLSGNGDWDMKPENASLAATAPAPPPVAPPRVAPPARPADFQQWLERPAGRTLRSTAASVLPTSRPRVGATIPAASTSRGLLPSARAESSPPTRSAPSDGTPAYTTPEHTPRTTTATASTTTPAGPARSERARVETTTATKTTTRETVMAKCKFKGCSEDQAPVKHGPVKSVHPELVPFCAEHRRALRNSAARRTEYGISNACEPPSVAAKRKGAKPPATPAPKARPPRDPKLAPAPSSPPEMAQTPKRSRATGPAGSTNLLKLPAGSNGLSEAAALVMRAVAVVERLGGPEAAERLADALPALRAATGTTG